MQSGKNVNSEDAELNDFAALLPELYYTMNRVWEDCTPDFSKKVGVALWALEGSTKIDETGKFLTITDLVTTFRDWFVVSERSAGPEVSKVKNELFERNFIKIEGGSDHIHLTERGEEAARRMHEKSREAFREALSVLSPEERSLLLDFAKRMIRIRRAPPKETARELFDQSGRNVG